MSVIVDDEAAINLLSFYPNIPLRYGSCPTTDCVTPDSERPRKYAYFRSHRLDHTKLHTGITVPSMTILLVCGWGKEERPSCLMAHCGSGCGPVIASCPFCGKHTLIDGQFLRAQTATVKDRLASRRAHSYRSTNCLCTNKPALRPKPRYQVGWVETDLKDA